MFTYIWNKIKDWSGWSAAGSIFTMRLEAFAGFVTAALLGMNWDALMALDYTNGFNYTVLAASGLVIAKAVLQEWVRRHNATDL